MARGFTLVELLIVLAVFGILFLIVGTISLNSLPKSQLLVSADQAEQTLRRAQALSVDRRADSVWGVHLTAGDMTLFAGETYVGRDVSYDEVTAFPAGISVSGLTDVLFAIRTGKTQNTGAITLTSDATGETEVLVINSAGSVDK